MTNSPSNPDVPSTNATATPPAAATPAAGGGIGGGEVVRGDDQEIVYYEGSPLLRGKSAELFTFGLMGMVLIFSPFLIHTFTKWRLEGWLMWGIVAIGGVLLLIPYLLTKSINYRVTNYRVDFERGLIAKSIDTIELWHIEDLKFHQTLFDRLLRVGSIQIIVRDPSNPRLVLNSLPNARTLFETLKQRVITVKRQPGVVKTDSGAL